MASPTVVFGVNTEGRTVAEGLIADADQAEALLAAGRRAGSELVWAHSAADLSALGFTRQWGYRRLEGRAAGDGVNGWPRGDFDHEVVPLAAEEESAKLWAEAFRGQWGHKTPQQWPLDLPPGTASIGLRKAGMTIGVCRIEPASGLIDAPGVVPAHREAAAYQALLEAALAAARTPSVTVESWGDSPERVTVCERLGLTTAKYVPGWQFALHTCRRWVR
jgi:hypothetical protein